MDEIILEKCMTQLNSPSVVYSPDVDKHFLIGEFYGAMNEFEIYAIKIMHLPHWSDFKKLSDRMPEFKYLYDTFQIVIDNHHNTIKFGPVGNILLSANRGIGLGSYCMSKLIERITSCYPGYAIRNGSLSFVDAAEKVNWAIRDTFYSHLGFSVDVDEKGDGKFSATVDALKTNYGKIVELTSLELLSQVYEQRSEIERLNRVVENCESRSLRLAQRYLERGGLMCKMWGGFTLFLVIVVAWFMSIY